MMIYTIKDLSKELKIDKQKIYRYIKKEKIEALGVSSEALQKWCEVHHETPQKNTKFYSEEAKKQVFDHFLCKSEALGVSSEAPYETLGVSSEAPYEALGVSSEAPHEALGVSSEAPYETPCEGELIDVLKAQIRSLEQDKENLQNIIDNQQKTLEQTQVLLSQEQALHLSLQNKVLQIETKTTEKISNYESDLEELKKELEEEKNKGFFSRLFRK